MSVLLYHAHGAPLISKDEFDIPLRFDPQDEQPDVECRDCGCTDEDGCAPDGCFWVGPGLCSSCCPALAEAWTVAPEMVPIVVEQLRREGEL